MKLFFRSVLEEYVEDFTIMYADGSTKDSGMGSAFVVKSISNQWTLRKMANVYTADFYAMCQGF